MRFQSVILSISILSAIACSKQAPVDVSTNLIKKDEIIVRIKTDNRLDDKTKVAAAIGIKNVTVNELQLLGKSYLKMDKYQTLVRVSLVQEDFDNIKRELENNPKIDKTITNRIYDGNPFDEDMIEDLSESVMVTEFEEPMHKVIQTEKAMEYARGEGIVVAVTDTGTDTEHRDLADNIWKNISEIGTDNQGRDKCSNGIDDDGNGKVDDCLGWNFVENNNQVSPRRRQNEQHGTHVAGIISAVENGEGTVGVAPDSKIMTLKFYHPLKTFTSSMIFDSYVYAVDNGARIINTSYNLDRFVDDDLYLAALEYAEDNNVIVVNSAGNGGKIDPPRLSIPNVLFVANTGTGNTLCDLDKKANTSNWGFGVDISAPGCKINSTISDGRYMKQTGTSMATPVVAGALALIWSQNPDWTKEMVVSRLLSTADDISYANKKDILDKIGSGRVNVFSAVNGLDQRTLSIKGFTNAPRSIDDSITFKIDGLADWNTLSDDTVEMFLIDPSTDLSRKDYPDIINNSAQKVETLVKEKKNLSYGSGTFTVNLENGNIAPGKYLIKVSSSLKDPFGKSVKANAKDQNFYKLIEIEDRDYISPVLNSIKFTGGNVITPENPYINISLNIEDDFSDLKNIEIEIRSKNNHSAFTKFNCNEDCRNDTGMIEFSIPAEKLIFSDDYYLKTIKIVDSSEYSRVSIYTAETMYQDTYKAPSHSEKDIKVNDGKFTLKGFKPLDKEKPQLTRSPEFLSNAHPGDKLVAKIFVEDKLSGIKSIKASLKSLEDGSTIKSNIRMFKALKGDFQKVQFDLKNSTKEGSYTLSSLLVIDLAGNSTYVFCRETNGVRRYTGTNIECPVVKITTSN